MRLWITGLFVLTLTQTTPAQTGTFTPDYLREVPADSITQGFLCPMHPGVTAEEKGQTCHLCGMALVEGRIRTPHGSHDPHYGGIFFMARDNWHHLEGAMPGPGLFRLYLYDNYSTPLSVDRASGTLVFQDFRDENGDEIRPAVSTPLIPTSDGVSFLVSDRRLNLERDFYLLMRFRPDQKEQDRFDFAFYEYSRPENAEPRATSSSALKIPLDIPETPEKILILLNDRVKQVETLILQSRLNEIFIPALEAKDLALALADAPGALDEPGLTVMRRAVKDIVKAGWLLDEYGDYGDRPAAQNAFRLLHDSVQQIFDLYP